MEKTRPLRTRRGSMFSGEKDRQKRPGTPHRNFRPLIRASESAAPVSGNYTDLIQDDDSDDPQEAPAGELYKGLGLGSPSPGLVTKSSNNETEEIPDSYLRTIHSARFEQVSFESLDEGRAPAVGSTASIRPGRGNELPATKSSQGTNTSTTPSGYPPLDGIHAGLGLGLGCGLNDEEPRDLFTVSDEEEEENEAEENQEKIRRLEVPDSIVFESFGGRRHSFGGLFSIQNISEYFMTFSIKSSEPEMFQITPSVGMLGPCANQEICVKTNPKFEFTFEDIAQEVFKVFATPVYTRKQMQQDKLEVLWRAFDTRFFPRIAAEEYTIPFLYQYFPRYTTESLLSLVSCNHRWLSSIWGNTKPVVLNSNPISEEEFYNVWPLEDDQYNFMTCRNQMQGWLWQIKKMKQETHSVKYEIRQCFGNFLLILFACLVLYTGLNPIPASYEPPSLFAKPMMAWLTSGGGDSKGQEQVVGAPSQLLWDNPTEDGEEGYWDQVKQYLQTDGDKD